MKQLNVVNNSKWHKHFWHETVIHVANNRKWHTSIFDMKQLSMCGKQQQMTHKHVWHETVIHMWQTTANDTHAFLTWNSYPYVANNSKWHTSIFDMKQLPYVANNSKWHTNITWNSFFDLEQLFMWQTTANDTEAFFDMKQLSICGKQQQLTHKHFWHETVIHMWQTTANGTHAFLTWNSYPYVANNSKWHTSTFDMKQLFMWQTTANDIPACWTWKSYPYVANNSKWHTSIFDMKQLP